MPSLTRFWLQGLFAIILTHSASNGIAQTSQTCSAERVIYTINGVLTDAGGAQEIADVVEEGYIRAYVTDTPLPRFKALHNPSGKKLLLGLGGALDFIEVLAQQTGLTVARLIRMIAGLELIEEPYNTIIGQIMSGSQYDSVRINFPTRKSPRGPSRSRAGTHQGVSVSSLTARYA